jgi:hypothetical protein
MKVELHQVDKYRQYVTEWQEVLCLQNWQIYVGQKKLADAYARTYTDCKGRVATIFINTSWDGLRPINDTELRSNALHECLHVLIADFYNEAQSRYTMEYDLDRTEESVVVQLASIILTLKSTRR